jgi:hypothetical protein
MGRPHAIASHSIKITTAPMITRYNEAMHKYRLERTGSDVRVFVDGSPKATVDANRRNEMRNYMASAGLTPDEINQKVHELYMTNKTEFLGSR